MLTPSNMEQISEELAKANERIRCLEKELEEAMNGQITEKFFMSLFSGNWKESWHHLPEKWQKNHTVVLAALESGFAKCADVSSEVALESSKIVSWALKRKHMNWDDVPERFKDIEEVAFEAFICKVWLSLVTFRASTATSSSAS